MLFYMYDLEDYKDSIRGFYFGIDKLPGKIITKEEELPANDQGEKADWNRCLFLKPIEAESQDEKFLSNIIRLIEDHLSESELKCKCTL